MAPNPAHLTDVYWDEKQYTTSVDWRVQRYGLREIEWLEAFSQACAFMIMMDK